MHNPAKITPLRFPVSPEKYIHPATHPAAMITGLDGSLSTPVTVTGSTVLTADDWGKVYIVNSSSSVTLSIPAMNAAAVGKPLEIWKIGTGGVVIDLDGTDTLDGSGSVSNTTSETDASLTLRVVAVGRAHVRNNLGSWI
jgi:hypothetical protein